MGRMKLSLQTCIVRQHWVERIISVCEPETRATRVVIHLQFTAWPGRSVITTASRNVPEILKDVSFT